jgi:hypothetical protein
MHFSIDENPAFPFFLIPNQGLHYRLVSIDKEKTTHTGLSHFIASNDGIYFYPSLGQLMNLFKPYDIRTHMVFRYAEGLGGLDISQDEFESMLQN